MPSLLDILKTHYRSVRTGWRRWRHEREWIAKGRPSPPPHSIKQKIVLAYAKRFRPRLFVETGTFKGDMIDAVRHRFHRLYTIELDPALHERAVARFSDDSRITVLHGDSGDLMPRVLEHVQEPCLFWLDGHYSGGITARGPLETPILAELGSILAHRVPGHVLLIDDARLFVGKDTWPTLKELKTRILGAHADWVVEVRDDILRAHHSLP